MANDDWIIVVLIIYSISENILSAENNLNDLYDQRNEFFSFY